jgi:hypothetical protein
MAKQDGKTAEACWLAIINAFWVGRLSALFIFGRRRGGAPGRVLTQLPPRSVLAFSLLGRARRFPAALRGWAAADYQKQPEPFGRYFARDIPFGLALRRAEFDRWRAGPAPRSDQNALVAAVTKQLAGAQPGRTVPWTAFCDAVRDECDVWTDRPHRIAKRGYSDKTIHRIVTELRRLKPDK